MRRAVGEEDTANRCIAGAEIAIRTGISDRTGVTARKKDIATMNPRTDGGPEMEATAATRQDIVSTEAVAGAREAVGAQRDAVVATMEAIMEAR